MVHGQDVGGVAVNQTRIEAVATKATEWADQLVDLGPRNTLLHYKDSRSTMLDLTAAPPELLTDMLAGHPKRLRVLVADDEYTNACARLRQLRKKLLHLTEEQGIEAGHLAYGLLTVTPSAPCGPVRSPAPSLRAPLLLYPVDIRAKNQAESDFTLTATEDAEVNPVLIYALSRNYGLDLDAKALAEKLNGLASELTDPAERAARVFEELVAAMGPHAKAARYEDRVLVGLFSFEKLPMVADLRAATDLLAGHDVIAAVAGVREAAAALHAAPEAPWLPGDQVPPREEFLVLDADSSQQRAIDTVLTGRHTVIEGPPGTGKSQTIANIIAALAARGRRVLFVSEKRAAIEAVVERLARVSLDGLVFDLHDKRLRRRLIAQQLAETLRQASAEPPPALGDLHERLWSRRQHAARHPAELHQTHQPWEMSIYEAQCELLTLAGEPLDESAARLRFRGETLRRLSGAALDEIQTMLKDFVDLGGARVRLGQSPWSNSPVRSLEEVRDIQLVLDELAGGGLHDAQRELAELVAAAGLRRPADVAGWQGVLNLLGAVEVTVNTFGPEVFGPELEDLRYATADRRWRDQHRLEQGFWRGRALRRRARQMHRGRVRDTKMLFAALNAAVHQRDCWRQLSSNRSEPQTMAGLQAALSDYGRLRDQLAAVAACTKLDGLDQRPTEELASTLDGLAEDRDTLYRMPMLNELADKLQQKGFGSLLDEVSRQAYDSDRAVQLFRRVWLVSLLDELRLMTPHLAAFRGQQHSRLVAEFRDADADHVRINASRVRRQVAISLREVRDAHPEQSALVRDQAARKSRHLPLRKLVEKAPDVMLAARPCWAMSPLLVSRVLPAAQLFDVVIFDEASQVEPQDAMTSIMRGKQLVVAGDDRQLPPSTFFRRMLGGDADLDDNYDEDNETAPDLRAYDSILDVLKRELPHTHLLNWHYRSQDERLIAFSNKEIYDGKLVTFPGVHDESPLLLRVVDGVVPPGQAGSAPREIEEVVRLVLEHAALRPDESLGVITMSQAHATRVEMALASARRDHPELADFFSEEREVGGRFFVKNLERVQGDERDAIILSIGYGKAANGRLRMNFGPVNNIGGERRLNVAVTRARQRMTIVSSFSHLDMNPAETTAKTNRGPELLRRLLEFASLGGGRMADEGLTGVEMNGLERSVYDALRTADVPVYPQWGVSGYRLDFALAHPEQPGRMVLAVETDGRRYHEAHSARDRDRLRQEHLSRLGWRFHRVWSTDWANDPVGETARIVEAWRSAIAGEASAASDPPEPPTHEAMHDAGAVSRRPRPRLPRGGPISRFSDSQLVAICVWLLEDGLQVARDERIAQAMAELGFQKRGSVILARLNQALDRAQTRINATEEQ